MNRILNVMDIIKMFKEQITCSYNPLEIHCILDLILGLMRKDSLK